MSLKIGITERGDAGMDFSWTKKLPGSYDCAVLITKNVNERFIAEAMSLHKKGFPFIVHATCTGLGGTVLEPNVPLPSVQLTNTKRLIDAGFPIERLVLRIDPVIPKDPWLSALSNVLDAAKIVFPEKMPRVRISVFDDYKHVKARFREKGLEPVYAGSAFYANDEKFARVRAVLDKYPEVTFETCAEPNLRGDNVVHAGCVGPKDLEILGIELPENTPTNPQMRSGCLCLMGKQDLLTTKRPCPHKCLYCYWRDR